MSLKPLNTFNMKSFYQLIKNARFFLRIKTVIIILFLMYSCNNDNDTMEDTLPPFGTCEGVNPQGNFSFSDSINGIFTYTTSGGGTIDVNPATYIKISHNDYPNFKLEFWGLTEVVGDLKNSGNHESLNSKHLKDRLDNRRTIIFPDGAKVTMVCDGNIGPMQSISIYEGNQYHHFNPTCNTLEYSVVNASDINQFDDAEPDGETGTFEFTETGLLFLNIYTENAPGQKTEERIPLGELFYDSPNTVQDHFDDPRIGHT